MNRSVALTLAILLIAGGLGAFLWAAPKMDMLRTFMGQLAMAWGGSNDPQILSVQYGYYGGMVGMGLGGIFLLGAIVAPRNSITTQKHPG